MFLVIEEIDFQKGAVPPPGFTPIPNSKNGYYHKRVGSKYMYWRAGKGVHQTKEEESGSKKTLVYGSPVSRVLSSEESITFLVGKDGQKEMAGVMEKSLGDPSSEGHSGKVAEQIIKRTTAANEWRNHKLAFWMICSGSARFLQGASWFLGGKKNPVFQKFGELAEKASGSFSPEEKVVGTTYAADYAWCYMPGTIAAGVPVSYFATFKMAMGALVGSSGLLGSALGFGVPAMLVGLTWYTGIGSKFYNYVIKKAAHMIAQKIYKNELDMDMLEKLHGFQYKEEFSEEQAQRLYMKALNVLLKSEGDSEETVQRKLAGFLGDVYSGALQDLLEDMKKGELSFDEKQTSYLKMVAGQMEKLDLLQKDGELSDRTLAMFLSNPFRQTTLPGVRTPLSLEG